MDIHPHNISKTAWFYAEDTGVLVVAELRDKNGNYLGTAQTKVPYRSLMRPVRDYQRRIKRKSASSKAGR